MFTTSRAHYDQLMYIEAIGVATLMFSTLKANNQSNGPCVLHIASWHFTVVNCFMKLSQSSFVFGAYTTLVNVYVDLLVFTRIAGTS